MHSWSFWGLVQASIEVEDLYERSTLNLLADKYHFGIQGKDSLGDQDNFLLKRHLISLRIQQMTMQISSPKMD